MKTFERLNKNEMKMIIGGNEMGGGGGGFCVYTCCSDSHTDCSTSYTSTTPCTSYRDCAYPSNISCPSGGHLFWHC